MTSSWSTAGRGAPRALGEVDAIVREPHALADDETLLVQSGKPGRRLPGRIRGRHGAHRQLEPRRQMGLRLQHSERAGLMMYRQMTAGSWIYIGTQGILQGTVPRLRRAGPAALRGDVAGGSC